MEAQDRIRTATMQGHVQFLEVDPETREIFRVVRGHNLITYEGADLVTRLLGGSLTSPINMMYIEFENGAANPVASRTQGRAYYAALVAPRDYLRVPLIAQPAYSASDGNYTSNVVRFAAMTSGSTGVVGETFNTSSHVVGAALVLATDLEAAGQDLVLSRYYLDAELVKASGREIVVQWSVTFE